MDRDKWQRSKGKPFKPAHESSSGVPAAKEVIPPGYEEYLLLLQQRNRLLKRLKEKDEHQIENEKKEQGFSIYVNGANVDQWGAPSTASPKGRSHSRQTKTADAYSERKKLLQQELQYLEKEAGEMRAKTAPGQTDTGPRRGWNHEAVQIKTEKGQRVKVRAPGKLSGKYSEDFESLVVDDDGDEEEGDIDYYLHAAADNSSDDDDDDDDDDRDELTLSFNEVETLRKSLEADASIRESIQAAQLRIKHENEAGERGNDSEEEEEIEEELEIANDSLNIRNSSAIERLPHLAQLGSSLSTHSEPSNAAARTAANETSMVTATHRGDKAPASEAVPLDLSVRKERTFVKESGKKEKSKRCLPDEDMVVLSFSSNSKTKKERVLSASRRKPGAEEVSLTKSSSTYRQQDQKDSPGKNFAPADASSITQEMKSASERRSRPLSATRRNESVSETKPADNVDEVLKAMQEENQGIDSSKSGSRTAPEKSKIAKIEVEPVRPASIGPCATDKTISLVTEKVRNMDPRQQQQLISLLSKLEFKESPYKMSSPSPSPRCSPIKATVPYGATGPQESSAASSAQFTPSEPYTQNDSSEPSGELLGEIDVNIGIMSNWGHPDTLGVTEVQFLGTNGKLIPYDASHVSLSGQVGDDGMLGNMANGKTKTTKDRFMWSCQFSAGHPVELMFHLPVNSDEGISKIVIWNFNRGVKDLSIGIKDVRIFVGGELTWQGIIDKGCGNQVFDYSKAINLIETEPKKPESTKVENPGPLRSETVILRRGSRNGTVMQEDASIAIEPEVEKGIKSGVMDSLRHSRLDVDGKIMMRSTSTPNLSSKSELQSEDMADIPREHSAALPSKPPWLSSNKKKGQSRSRSSSRSKSRPIWLEDNKDDNQDSKRSHSTTDMSSTRLPTPESARRRSSPVSLPADGSGPSGLRTGTPTGRSHSLSDKTDQMWPGDFAARKEPEQLPTCLDDQISPELKDARRVSEAVHGRRGTPSPAPGHVDSAHPPPHAADLTPQEAWSRREQCRQNQSLSLEESWNVLSLFEKCHKGRITKDVDLQPQDDALDDFLASESPRPGSRKEQRVEQQPANDESRLIDLEIPTLPQGKQLVINIRSTWGDRHYVGLNGVEVFTEEGKPVEIAEITADPSDINILPGYGSDPRVVTNIIDGVYRTRDDMHLWLAPFTATSNHYITITFTREIRIAMIRIWNYNKSRIHSYRGARNVEFTLDGSLIFHGEIERASGTLGADEPFGDTILFTMDESILYAMAINDDTYEVPAEEEELVSSGGERPSTADRDADTSPTQEGGERPFTCARQRKKMDQEEVEIAPEQGTDIVDEVINGGHLDGRVLQLNFVSTWGDPFYLGLTGLELLGPGMQTIPLQIDMLEAIPRDINDLHDYDDDDRTLDKVIDGINVTTSDEHMWLIPFTEGGSHTLTIDLGQRTELIGMRVWNYNKSLDGTFRGAKIVHVTLDGKAISSPEGYLLRKGPGNVHFDFAQDIFFSNRPPAGENRTSVGAVEPSRRSHSRVNIKKLVPDYEPALMPTGFVFQFHLLTSWGDPYYIGLNGLEFYDAEGYRIRLSANDVTAYPHSVNVLDGVKDDARTPDKLVDGVNDTVDGKHMWLAPVFPGQINLIYVIFDEPKTVSMIKMWNYSKTPIRGVQQFGILVDDLLVYHGFLPQVPRTGCRGILPNLDMPVPHHTVLFTDSPDQVTLEERTNLVRCNELEQDVQLTNDNRVVTRHATPNSAKAADPVLRPMTSVRTMAKQR